jgi:hypothetical protein
VLKSLDVLIGLTIVLLALSMAVTVITQSITAVLNSRGRHLRRGLTDLLQQLDPALTETLSREVATKVLTHPLVSGSASPIATNRARSGFARALNGVRRLAGGARLGNVVHREEFTKLLMGLACEGGTGDATAALKKALETNGVGDPAATLKTVRDMAMKLEKSSPELSHTIRQNMALLHGAESDLVAKINNWFDQTMDRTSQRFTASTRAITFVAAFVVAFGLQVDTPNLVNRLAADDQLRNALVKEAQDARAREDAQRQAASSAEPKPAQPPAAAEASNTTTDPNSPAGIDQKYRAFLAEHGLIKLPSAGGWVESFQKTDKFGLLITALLLSLGAPFWYGMLGKLLQLRSVLATKEGEQRSERQSTETASADATRASVARAAAALPV